MLTGLLGADASATRISHKAAEGYEISPERAAPRQWSATTRAGWPASTNGNLTGFSVAVSGNTAVVAAPGATTKTATNAGTAYIYERSGGKWHRVKTLADPRGQPQDFYAWAVAIARTKAGTYIVAVGGNDSNSLQDLVYIYTGSGKVWHLLSTLSDPGTTSEDMYGDVIVMTGSTLVISASCFNNLTGEVWIYERSGRHWKLHANIIDPNNHAGDTFGESIAISGDTVLAYGAGVVYDFARTPVGTWPLITTIPNPGDAAKFGAAIAISGATAVIGAPGMTPSSAAGAAYVFRRSGTTWTLKQTLIEPKGIQGMEFGYAIAMTATGMLIGMPAYGTVNCGTAFLLRPASGRWVIRRRIKNPSCTANDQFGYAVAISGAAGVFGAPHTNNDSGAAYFKLLS